VALFWSMVAIESLFTSGEQGLTQQVRERTQLLLGRSKRAAKMITTMYNIRSKFVHGKLDFAGAHDLSDTDTNDEVDQAVDTAVAIVIATLQIMIERGWSGIRFATTMEGIPGSTPPTA